MLLGCPWLRDAKVSHDRGINIITIQGTSTIGTILVTNKFGVQTKRPEVLVCYDFHPKISNDKEDVMFATKLDMFSIGTIIVPTHIKPIPKSICIPRLVPKQLVKPIGVLAIKLTIPPYTIKQHLLETFFHLEVGRDDCDETLVREQVHDLTITSWIITKEKQFGYQGECATSESVFYT
jgi:hypothetical protein